MTEPKLDSTYAAAVGDYYWQPMSTCPRSAKVQLKGAGGVATYGHYSPDKFWVGWAPLPKTKPDGQDDRNTHKNS